MAFIAKYDGTCPECHDDIVAGQDELASHDGQYVHVGCLAARASARPPAKICPICNLQEPCEHNVSAAPQTYIPAANPNENGVPLTFATSAAASAARLAPRIAAAPPVVQDEIEAFFQANPVAYETLEEIVEAKVPRDRFDRPLILQPDGVSTEPYNRASSFGGQLDDKTKLYDWVGRQIVRGTAILMRERPSFLSSVPERLYDPWNDQEGQEKNDLDSMANQAKEAAGSSLKSQLGTDIHYATELIDAGDELENKLSIFEPWRKDLLIERANAYYKLTSELGLKWDTIETFGVQDDLQVAGTWDRRGYVPWWPEHAQTIGDVKGLALGTPLVTPSGWTTMGDVKVGDQVLGPDGKPTVVTLKSEPKRIGTYVVRFDDGAEIICDSEHIWWTERSWSGKGTPEARPISEVIETLRGPHGQAWHRVPVARSLDLPEVELPVEPYLLGCWLGDGCKSNGAITKNHELFDVLESRGTHLGRRGEDQRRKHVVTARPVGLAAALRKMGLQNAKRIPEAYLRGSIEQRTALAQGLLDTDGGWNIARGREVFSTTDEAMAYQVEELLLSLGQKPHVAQVERTGFGLTVDCWTVEFLPFEFEPHILPAKRAAWLSGKNGRSIPTTRASRRVIVSVEPGPDLYTACIAVNNNSHVYLAGRRMIPTHNTSGSMDFGGLQFGVQLAAYAHMQQYVIETGERIPHDDMNEKWALIIHVDRNKGGPVEPFKVNIAWGWEKSRLAREVILARREGSWKGNRAPIQRLDERELAILSCTARAELHELADESKSWPAWLRDLAKERWTELAS